MKIAHDTLVVAMDGAKMLIFRNEGDRKFTVLDTLEHQEAKAPPARALGSDAPGRAFSSTGKDRSSYAETDWHEQAEERFAIAGAQRLERLAQREAGEIVVLAPPRVLGTLRKHWGRETSSRLAAEIGKDVVHREWDVIARTIADYSPPA